MTTPEQTRDAWNGVAAGYDEFVTPLVIPLAEQVLGRIHLRSGMSLLDVAAGTGALSLLAARIGAQVVATDIAPGMIERLEARARAEGLSNLEARVMDGLDLELENDTFDVSASQLGVTVIPDLKAALGEMVRVTKSGGRVLIAALGPPQKAEFFGVFLAALQATITGFTGPPTDPPPPQFQVADPATFRERLAEAGLEDITVETVTFGLEFRSSADLWGFLMSSNPMGRILVANLSEEQRTEVREVLAGMLRERSGPNGKAVLNLDINIGAGTK
ncbi:MAG TPA: methyltransferase domain-containing protein [Actinomycetota bacterium]|jgi:ubiquinone/menaquinone biosynthesis C-methylase UbiE|nr:methyltransferase domain-containing protein [Actinomycetota bacterium]